MNIGGWRREQEQAGPIRLTVPQRMADRLRAIHAESQLGCAYGGRTSLEQYCLHVIEWFLVDHRSGKVPNDPLRHTERNGCDADHVVE